ncbi:hypothetical protein EON64_00520 [archaeon]|nr:MAG: hypothetical protein EON64_00520 [archaeon]
MSYSEIVNSDQIADSPAFARLFFACDIVVLCYSCLAYSEEEPGENATTATTIYQLCGHVVATCLEVAIQETTDYSLRCMLSDQISKVLNAMMQRKYVDTLHASRSSVMEKLEGFIEADHIYVELRDKLLGVSMNSTSYTLYLSILFMLARTCLSRRLTKLACWAFVQALTFRDSCGAYMEDPLYFPFLQEEIESLSDSNCLSAIDDNLQYVFDKLLIPLLRVYSAFSDKQKKSRHAETVLNILIDSMFRSKGVDKVTLAPQSYFRNIWRCTRLLAAICTDIKLVEIYSDSAGSKRIRHFLHNRMEIPVPHDYLLKDFSLIVVFLLLSPGMQRHSVAEIVQGTLNNKLQHGAQFFQIQAISRDDTNAERYTISLMLFHQVLLPLVWMLGSEAEDESQQGRRSILALCCCFVHDGWLVDKKRLTERHLLQHAQKELPQHFLHIMSSLLQHQWASQTAHQQCQNLRALRCLISILLPADVTKYLPKVLTMVESALTDFTRPSVQLSAVTVIVTLVNCLSKELLSDNLYEMLVFLFPVIETSSSRLDPNERSKVPANFSSLFGADQYAEHNSAMLDSAFPCSKELSQKAVHPILEAKKLAVQLLCDLFASEPDFVVHLPYLPHIEDLQDLRAHLEAKVNPLSLPERVQRLTAFLKSNRLQVIYAGLVTCRDVIRKNKGEMLHACVQQRLSLFNIGGDNAIVHEVSNLIVSLINIATRQQNSRILVLCSACLGDIGALHPSFTVGEEGVMTTAKSSMHSFSPLNLDTLSFGLQVLTDYIVPGLKAAQGSSEQDKSAFAAQEVLRFLARHLEGYDDEEDSKLVGAKGKGLPSALKSELLKRGIYEIVEPFWHSKYIQKPNERLVRVSNGSSGMSTQVPSLTLTTSISDGKRGNYYSRSKSFHLWLAAWSRNLITLTLGNLKPIFLACRGMLHTSVELCQFLLPYLIVDVAVNSSAHASFFLTELKTVLQSCRLHDRAESFPSQDSIGYAVNETDRKAIQFVFTLLDTFTSWHAEAQKQLLKLEAAESSATDSRVLIKSSGTSKTGSVLSKSSDDDRRPGSNKELVLDTRNALGSILSALPSDDLSESALRIHAYARTIRYIETFAKDRYNRDGNNDTLQHEAVLSCNALPLKRDMHVYDEHLPILSKKEANSLSSAFAKLGDTDALQGVRAVSSVISGGSTSTSDNILWYEQQSDWYNALLEYEFLQSSSAYRLAFNKSLYGFGSAFISAGISGSTSMTRRNKRFRLEDSSRVVSEFPLKARGSIASCMSMQEVNSIQKGKLRCLIELEKLEAVVTALQVQLTSDVSADSVATESTLSLGIEAAWKLSDWSKLDFFLTANDSLLAQPDKGEFMGGFVDSDDMYQLHFGQLLSHIHGKQFDRVPAVLDQARLLTMGAFSAASMESYERAYPYLLRLHCLSDVEDVHRLVSKDGGGLDSLNLVEEMENNLQWTERLDCMSETIAARSHVLATHRSLYTLIGSMCSGGRLSNDISVLLGRNRIYLSTYLKELGKYDLALTALKYAQQCGVSEEEVVLRKGKLLLEQGLIREALSAVEPTEVDARALLQILQGNNELHAHMQTEQKRRAVSEKLFLATQCLAMSQQCQGTVIIDRYQAITALTPQWDKPYLHFAKYYEYLFIQYNSSASKQHSAGRTNNISVVLGHVISGGSSAKDYSLIEHAIRQYGQCLSVCSDLVTIAEVLPRMLTLWLSFTALSAPGIPSKRAGSAEETASPLKAAQQRVNDLMKSFVTKVSSQVWYSSVAQLISRVLHPSASTVDVILSIITQCWLNYPKHTLWHTANLMNSFNAERKAIAKTLLRDVYKQFTNPSSPYYSKENAQMLADSQNFFRDLVQLACLQTRERRISFRIDKKVCLPNFLIPNKQVLLACANGGTADRIAEFVEVVEVTNSKARPKVISLLSSSGQKVKFLCKQEKDGDLRKDAHMMEVNTLVNRLLGSSMGGRQRKLRVTTYGVICLHEECGLLEWVNNTECLRHLVNLSHSYDPAMYPNIVYKEIQQEIVNIQNKHDCDIPAMTQAYRELVTSFHYRPCFSKWFLHRHTDPTAWLQARKRFTHSVAVWSAVGYLIGLGDRHTENILVSSVTCEAVHVDFDCLFDKGLMLLKPEIVPFRLTANMVDAMGVTGVEGVYRKALELTLSILREHSETFLSVLEPFLRDPTVSWGRSGRAQRDDLDGSKQGAGQATDVENKEANDMLGKIADRLRGVFNLEHPHRDKILRHCAASGGSIPDTGKGLGASKEDQLLPLSVEGLAQRLIDEATALENLAQLYVGKLFCYLLTNHIVLHYEYTM